MARITDLDEALKKFDRGTGANEFFTLKDDKDTAMVRLLHGDKLVAGEDWFVVHEVEITYGDGTKKKRWVECTQEDDCPLCQSGNNAQLKLFLQLIQKGQESKVKTWERGKTMIPTVRGLMERYGALCKRPWEIERQGKAGDTATKYAFYNMDPDKNEEQIAELMQKRQVLASENGFILKKPLEVLKQIAAGTYVHVTQSSNTENQSSAASAGAGGQASQPTGQRAPANTGGSDVF